MPEMKTYRVEAFCHKCKKEVEFRGYFHFTDKVLGNAYCYHCTTRLEFQKVFFSQENEKLIAHILSSAHQKLNVKFDE